MKIRVGVFFGGKSVEHEVSVISAMQAIAALDQQKYQAVPIYITKENQFYTGEHLGQIESYQDIPGALKRAARITLIGGQNTAVLQCYPPKKLGSSQIIAGAPVSVHLFEHFLGERSLVFWFCCHFCTSFRRACCVCRPIY